ncbi:phosphoesterase family-domain-containing protein [Thamnocephalis sphaerospora]|uniref:Phosphoesterase family-domain-containing protein n=1 Tax=Thamnocephalis sphaerospora TaxID=78915 RepID=A0A4P9XLJ5_9FUNG|nr:phosphoesterase family-domain-containing protein [Thamnocephalis sphaerospora]|eukprot:RKP06682.1 phosphoesterase family-domain-containing protein [Thamnocephalis sphaerospora]
MLCLVAAHHLQVTPVQATPLLLARDEGQTSDLSLNDEAAGAVQGAVSPPSTTNTVPGKYFDRVMIINFENTNYADVSAHPYWQSLAKRGRVLSNYNGVTHPSQPNYVAQLFGSTKGVWFDFDSNVKSQNLVDLLENKGVSWKGYMEAYPGGGEQGCFTKSSSEDGLYRRKHNPFMTAENIRENPARCAKIVNADEFERDLTAGTLPQFIYYTPDMNNDGHDTTLDYASDWLKGFLEPKLERPDFLRNTLLVLTFDENGKWLGRNWVMTLLMGDPVGRTSSQDNAKYDHYSLLRTVEDNWDLGSLGRHDAEAAAFGNLNLRS